MSVALALDEGDGFDSAWSHFDAAAEARQQLAAAWRQLCDAHGFDATVIVDSDGQGRLDVTVDWPGDTLRRAEKAAARFAHHIRGAFDDAVAAAAVGVCGQIPPSMRQDHRMPLRSTPREFAEDASARLVALRPDQIRVIEKFQPIPDSNGGTDTHGAVRRLMQHLAEMVQEGRSPGRSRVAVWTHSAAPEIWDSDFGSLVPCETTGDGLLEFARTVATFSSDRPSDVFEGNPKVAFDMVFNDQPWPVDPDDNMHARSAGLLVLAREFIRAMTRSVATQSRSNLVPNTFASFVRTPAATPWSLLAPPDDPDGAVIASAVASSDLGLAIHWDADDNMSMLVHLKGTVFQRPIPNALPLDTSIPQGTAAEDASVLAASKWGMPDFVLWPITINKGRTTREVGDATIVTGNKGLSVQVKSRVNATSDYDRELHWVQKKSNEGMRQAQGSVRSLRIGPMSLVNGRGREVQIDGEGRRVGRRRHY